MGPTATLAIATFIVPEASCGHCRAAIAGQLSRVDGVAGAAVNLDTKTVTVIGNPDQGAVLAAIREAGYDAQPA